MKKQLSTSKKGFTIIEVVLVLAIAGLIFLMVFVALPSLQRSQRDTQRRDDMSRLASALTQYQANNNNNLPTSGPTLISSYLAEGFKDPNGTDYTVSFSSLASGESGTAVNGTTGHEATEIIVYTNAYCSGETATYKAGSSNYAILYKLEGSGATCVDNQ